jgi:hypothetical protein
VKLGLHQNYWFSYYTNCARFRVLTEDYEALRGPLEKLRDSLGLIDRGEEKENFTLKGDLGHGRFLSEARNDKDSEKRAKKVLSYLNSVCDLYIDNLVLRGDGYWTIEKSTHEENPLGNNFESLAHLLANISGFEFDVSHNYRTPWMQNPPAPRFRCHL